MHEYIFSLFVFQNTFYYSGLSMYANMLLIFKAFLLTQLHRFKWQCMEFEGGFLA